MSWFLTHQFYGFTNRKCYKVGVYSSKYSSKSFSSEDPLSERNITFLYLWWSFYAKGRCTANTDSIVREKQPISLWRRANARNVSNVRLFYPHWQYSNLFIFRFVSLLCLSCTLRLLRSKRWTSFISTVHQPFNIFHSYFYTAYVEHYLLASYGFLKRGKMQISTSKIAYRYFGKR